MVERHERREAMRRRHEYIGGHPFVQESGQAVVVEWSVYGRSTDL